MLKIYKENQKKKILILGGGLAGLAAADKLLDKDYDILILERANFLGGLASSFQMEDEEIPRFNHHIVRSNTITLDYLKRYNLMGNNTWKKIKMAIAVNEKLYNINTPQGLLKFNFLSLKARIKLGLFGAYLIFLMNPEKIPDDMDAESWLLKYAGKEVTEKIWYNLYARNKFNIDLKQISAKQFAHRLYEKEGYDDFTFPMKGIQGMVDGLEKDIKNKQGIILTNAYIQELDLENKKIKYRINQKENEEYFDAVINTIPAPELLKFTKGLPEEYIDNINKLKYVSVVGLCFATENFLDNNNYWINLINERIHVIYQHSMLIDKYKSKVTWCVRYGGSEEDITKTDDEIKKLYLAVLQKYFPEMKLIWCFVFREKYAEPIYDKDYLKYAPSYETPIKYLFNAGIQVTFPKIRNMNVAIESGIKAAEIVETKI